MFHQCPYVKGGLCQESSELGCLPQRGPQLTKPDTYIIQQPSRCIPQGEQIIKRDI